MPSRGGARLSAGGLVAFPTETVYGLGADATDGTAVARLYAAKGRPSFNPLIAHVADIAAARELAIFDDDAERLAAAFWPGPLTLVLPKHPRCPVAELATAGLDSIAVRVPDHPVARDILRAFGKPIVAPSANRSGHVSPTTAAHVMADMRGRIDLIVDGGPAPVGVESTIVACLDRPVLLRPGGLPRAEIERVLGHGARGRAGRRDRPRGAARARHAGLALRAEGAGCASMPTRCGAGEALLAFGREAAGGDRKCRPRAQPLGLRRSGGGRGQPVLASARARRAEFAGHRRDAGCRTRASAKRSTTGWRAPPRREIEPSHR